MCAELHIAGAGAMLAPFHARTFEVLGLPRASGPFQYPNIAAMYLEAALPLAIAVGAALDARRRAAGHARAIAGSVGGVVVAVLLAYALSLTVSRAALVTAGVVLAGAAAYARWRRAPSLWPAAAALAAAVVVAAAAATGGPLGELAASVLEGRSLVPLADRARRAVPGGGRDRRHDDARRRRDQHRRARLAGAGRTSRRAQLPLAGRDDRPDGCLQRRADAAAARPAAR